MPFGPQHESWFRIATRCAVQIRKRLGVPDPKTEARIVRVFRAALRPRGTAGRRPDAATVPAGDMWIAGMGDYAHGRKPVIGKRGVFWPNVWVGNGGRRSFSDPGVRLR